MTDHSNTIHAPLVYKGEIIRDRGEMLSLTDMWKAAGEPDTKRPANWARKEGQPFIEAVALSQNMPVGHIMRSQRGKGGSTFAHWQIGLAYAKYLSPEFHMWCNEVVRQRMEQSHAATGISPVTLEQIERSFGIMRMLSHKVTEMEKALPGIVTQMVEPMVAARLAERAFLLRRGKTAGQIWKEAGFPPIRVTSWFSNRLCEMQCQIDGGGRGELGLGTAKLFDPDKAQNWLRNGGRKLVDAYVAERQGQGKLRLVSING